MRCHSLGLLCAQLTLVWSCAAGPYHYGKNRDSSNAAVNGSATGQVAFKYGKPQKTLDRMSDIVSWPRRVFRPDTPDKRTITSETTDKLREYLSKNDLMDVEVTVRDYDPGEQWSRLRDNRIVPGLSRYTLGVFSMLNYALIPGRVFGRNEYNPYTNTLYVNSEAPALVVHEAAFAKNLRARPWPGVYAVASSLPFLSALHEIDSAREVVAYARAEEDWALEQESYREIYPRVGSEATGGMAALVPVWWGGPVLGLAGSAMGSVAGRTVLARRQHERDQALDARVTREVTGVQQATYEEPVGSKPEARRTVASTTASRQARREVRTRGSRAKDASFDPQRSN